MSTIVSNIINIPDNFRKICQKAFELFCEQAEKNTSYHVTSMVEVINASLVHSSVLHTPSVWNLPSLRSKTIWNLVSCPQSRSSNYQTTIRSNHRHGRRALGEQAASLRDSSFTSEALNKSHRPHQQTLAFLCPYSPQSYPECISSHNSNYKSKSGGVF